jgi:hypothetical protein
LLQDDVSVSGSDLSDVVDEPVIPREKAGARRAAAAAVSTFICVTVLIRVSGLIFSASHTV